MIIDEGREYAKWNHHWPQATVGAVIANVNRDADKRPDPFTPEDIMPHLAPPKEETRMVLTPEEIREREAAVEYAKMRLALSKAPGVRYLVGDNRI
jgi:hypothetical protein